MLSSAGHIIHIDFGFLLGIAPGGSFSLETAPFKLTGEMVEAMGGLDSEGFHMFVRLFTRGFLACQKQAEEICALVEVMSVQSTYPCFVFKESASIIAKLRARFRLDLTVKEDVVKHTMSLVRKSHNSSGTRQYDNFQRMTNGILP